MERPAGEITAIFESLCTTLSPDSQKVTIEKYFASDAGLQHPIYNISRGRNSRDKILKVYQWCRIMVPRPSLNVEEVVYDRHAQKLFLTVRQMTPFFFSPFSSKSTSSITILKLTPSAPHYIIEQSDYYQPEQLFLLAIPPLAPLIVFFKIIATTLCDFNAKIGQSLFGAWKTANDAANGHTTNRHAH